MGCVYATLGLQGLAPMLPLWNERLEPTFVPDNGSKVVTMVSLI
jgi:hypothetical protein